MPSSSAALPSSWGAVQVVPSGTIQATVVPSWTRRRVPSGRSGACPLGAKSERQTSAGPVTGACGCTGGSSISWNPTTWVPRIAVAEWPSTPSQRSRMRQAPARSSQMGRTPVKGIHAAPGAAGSNR